MFKSKRRPIIVPQSEHARLSGIVASLWGNDNFDRPSIDFESFVTGVIYHDRGYDLIDDGPIGELDEDAWLAYKEKSRAQSFRDQAADLVIKLQLKRLVGYSKTPKREAFVAAIEKDICEQVERNSFDRAAFEWADRITNFCDNLAFDFCFEEEKTGSCPVYQQHSSSEQTELHYAIKAEGVVELSPWPLAVAEHSGFITGYHAENYPQLLEPMVIRFTLRRA